MIQFVTRLTLMVSCLLLHACASQPITPRSAGTVDAGSLPVANPGLDHYIAWVPLERAQTATVAEAMTHISLKNAREQTSHDLCDGIPVTGGVAVEKYGPVTSHRPVGMGGQPAWYYRISIQPGLQGCEQQSTARLYEALQTRLPSWIDFQPAGHAAGAPPTSVVRNRGY